MPREGLVASVDPALLKENRQLRARVEELRAEVERLLEEIEKQKAVGKDILTFAQYAKFDADLWHKRANELSEARASDNSTVADK